MPLTDFQRTILALLAETRSPDSYLAGGTALQFSPNSTRFSKDLVFCHDSAERVASAYAEDSDRLRAAACNVEVILSQPGFVRAVVSRDDNATRIDWAHDSAWRFMPPVRDELGGFLKHEIDLAINKTLALAGRDVATLWRTGRRPAAAGRAFGLVAARLPRWRSQILVQPG